MNKIFLGAVFGVTFMGSAGASIISRGFFDEKIADYATMESLNSKADKSELTTLSEIIGTPAELTYRDVISGDLELLFGEEFIENHGTTQIPTDNISELLLLNYTDPNFPGIAGVIDRLFYPYDYSVGLGNIFSDYDRLTRYTGNVHFWALLDNGGDMDGKKAYGLPKLTEEVDKIGTLPDGYNNLADALAAVKITADTAKELAEKAIPNVLNESSNGKYVLTAEKVGDTATYKWEIIDRTVTENTTTNE
ncbi:MAG: hypothetical protein IJN91_00480 [Alphaproteobacteria bacterium]|nr:hypothetical protein [Alphaproteobacteria bacterium]